MNGTETVDLNRFPFLPDGVQSIFVAKATVHGLVFMNGVDCRNKYLRIFSAGWSRVFC